ncbi:MAG: hypothetical protein Q9209_004785 [Squamulea sp. 1 TL-2023]
MAAAEAIVLSSPSRHGFITTNPSSMIQHAISSSPVLPSLSEIFDERMARPKNRSISVATPCDAAVGFISASNVLQPAPMNYEAPLPSSETVRSGLTANHRKLHDKGVSKDAGKSRKEVAKSGDARGQGKSQSSKKSKIPADAVITASDEDGIDPQRKKQTKRPKDDGQTKIKKAKVTKPRSGLNNPKLSRIVCTEENPGIATSGCDMENIEADLGLTEAVKRRRDWTPTRDTAREPNLPAETEAAWSALVPSEPPSVVNFPDGGLLKRLGEYGYAKADHTVNSRSYPQPDLSGQAITKKRKLDLFTGLASVASKMVLTKRSRSPKKKPQTITDKATAPFAPSDQASTPTLLNYFPNQYSNGRSSTVRSGQQQETGNEPYENFEPSSKGKTLNPKVKKKVKDPVILHPPELAVKVANEQDLLFGTSSQLARDESPTFTRDLQRAYKESEAVDSQPFSQSHDSQLSIKSAASKSSNTKLPFAVRDLWSVAARDDDGHLHEVDVVDLVDTPEAPRSLSTKFGPMGAEKENSDAQTAMATAEIDEDWRSIYEMPVKHSAASPSLNQQQAGNLFPRSVAEASLRARSKSKSPVKNFRPHIDQGTPVPDKEPQSGMPNYHGFTDNNLKLEVTATGFKNIRKREDRISHLKACWHAKQSRRASKFISPETSTPSTSTNVAVEEAIKPSSPTKKRGRPSKNASPSTDGNGATIAPRKPRGRPRKGAFVQSQNLEVQDEVHFATHSIKQHSETQDVDMSETNHIFSVPASPRHDAKPRASAFRKTTAAVSRTKITRDIAPLLATITRAVMTYPPTHNIHNLTPYEKMLLYDPIVLEDLAQWLNDEGLKRVGYKEMVDPMIAKMWCESQSVCCLWRENLRGGTRARY